MAASIPRTAPLASSVADDRRSTALVIIEERRSTALVVISPSPRAKSWIAGTALFKSVRSFAKGVATTARLMVGVPDYERYVQHRQTMHPGEPVMSYEEFFKERQNSRYGGKISRCC